MRETFRSDYLSSASTREVVKFLKGFRKLKTEFLLLIVSSPSSRSNGGWTSWKARWSPLDSPSHASILIKIKNFSTSFSLPHRRRGSGFDWISAFHGENSSACFSRSSPPGRSTFLSFRKVIIYVWIESEAGVEKLFIIQQQEKLWAIKKDWIWLKSLLSVSCMFSFRGKGKTFSISTSKNNAPHREREREREKGNLLGFSSFSVDESFNEDER